MQFIKIILLSLLVVIIFIGINWFSDSSISPKVELEKLEKTYWEDKTGVISQNRSDRLTFWQNDDGLVGADTSRKFIVKKIIPTNVDTYKAEISLLGIKGEYNIILDSKKKRLTFVDAKYNHRSFYFTRVRTKSPHPVKDTTPCLTEELYKKIERAQVLSENEKYEESLKLYKEIHNECPDKNLEDGMAWILSQIPSESPSPNPKQESMVK